MGKHISGGGRRVTSARTVVGNPSDDYSARATVSELKALDKKGVFDVWKQTMNTGRIASGADIREQRKSWMIYDIVRKRYDAATADRVA